MSQNLRMVNLCGVIIRLKDYFGENENEKRLVEWKISI